MAPKKTRLPDGSFQFKDVMIADALGEDAAIKEAIEACHAYGEASVEIIDTYHDEDGTFQKKGTYKSYQLDDEGRAKEDEVSNTHRALYRGSEDA